MLYNHEQLYIHICMQKHIQHNKDERQSSLEKYTSHFIWKGSKGLLKVLLCERELETEQNCNILTPTLMAITAFLFRSPGLLNQGPRGPASLGYVPHSNIFFPTHLNFRSPGLYNNLTHTLLPASVTISHSIQPLYNQGHILIFLDRMHLLFTQVDFRLRQLGWGQYATYIYIYIYIYAYSTTYICRLGRFLEGINVFLSRNAKLILRTEHTAPPA